MAISAKVAAVVDGVNTEVIVQGFRRGGSSDAYVFIGALVDDALADARDITLTPENAHILGEEIRKHAEYSLGGKEDE